MISEEPVRSGMRHDSVTKRVDTITATTPVGADGTSPPRSAPGEPARVWGVVSWGEVGSGASGGSTGHVQ